MRLERFSKLFDLSGKVAIVTGGAQGNGQAIANALDDAGATVVVTDVVYGELSAGLHDKISNRRIMDVTDEPAVRRTMGEIYEQYGHLDILVNNAGIMYKDYICDLDIERFRKVLDLCMTFVAFVCFLAICVILNMRLRPHIKYQECILWVNRAGLTAMGYLLRQSLIALRSSVPSVPMESAFFCQ